jgi:hypothetical protein
MGDELRSILLGTAGLSAAALVAVLITLTRGLPASEPAALQGAARVAGLAVTAQSVHFVEELATGFHRRFPEQLGLAPWPLSFFVTFNVFWLVVWTLSCRGLVRGRQAALAALWFLGIAGLANGVAHVLLSLRTGGYFPGLVSSPFVFGLGLLLVRRLAAATRPDAARGPDD